MYEKSFDEFKKEVTEVIKHINSLHPKTSDGFFNVEFMAKFSSYSSSDPGCHCARLFYRWYNSDVNESFHRAPNYYIIEWTTDSKRFGKYYVYFYGKTKGYKNINLFPKDILNGFIISNQ